VFSPADAAATIREYIANFFGCKECRDHFLSQYDQCSFRRCDRLTDDANASTIMTLVSVLPTKKLPAPRKGLKCHHSEQ
jgi:hypothetical protein